jgi:hypothetical protein
MDTRMESDILPLVLLSVHTLFSFPVQHNTHTTGIEQKKDTASRPFAGRATRASPPQHVTPQNRNRFKNNKNKVTLVPPFSFLFWPSARNAEDRARGDHTHHPLFLDGAARLHDLQSRSVQDVYMHPSMYECIYGWMPATDAWFPSRHTSPRNPRHFQSERWLGRREVRSEMNARV